MRDDGQVVAGSWELCESPHRPTCVRLTSALLASAVLTFTSCSGKGVSSSTADPSGQSTAAVASAPDMPASTSGATDSVPPPTASGTNDQVTMRASVEPSAVRQGETFTLTPASLVQPICGLPLIVYLTTPPMRFAVLWPGTGEWYQYGVDEFAFPECLPAPTSDAQTFRVPADFPSGDYMACFGQGPDGCGALTIE